MIDTCAIRKKILSLAMQGKLTEQLPEDGNAKDLYDNIQLEMSLLIKAKKIKKIVCKGSMGKRDFFIPDNWVACTLSEISYSVGSKNNQIQTNEINSKGKYPVISQGLQYIDGYSDIEEKAIVDVPVVLFGDHTINVKYIDVPFVIGADGTKILKPLGVDSVFFYYAITHMANGIVTRGYSRHFAQLTKQWFFMPPRNEQLRIVNRINELFEILDKIDELQSQYATDLEVLKSKLIGAGIQGKLTEQLLEDGTAEELYADIQEEKIKLIREKTIKKEKRLAEITETEIPFDIPAHWKWVRLADIANRVWAGGDKPNDFAPIASEGRNIPVVANGVTNDGILGYTSDAKAPAETITVAGRGTIGFCTYRNYEYCPIVRLIVIEPSRGVSPKYLKLVMHALQERSVGSSIPQLTVPMIKPKLIPLPPYKEQLRIVDKIDEFLSLI